MANGTEPTWEQAMWDLLCALYRILGGDCDELAPRPVLPPSIAELKSLYDSKGDPKFATEQERLDFLALLDDTEAHLALPGNSLSDADNGIMNTLIADMRAGASSSP